MPTFLRVCFIFHICLLSASSALVAQSHTDVVVRMPDGEASLSVRQALSLIADQTSFKPSYVDQSIPFDKKIKVNGSTILLDDLLDKIVLAENLKYQFEGNLILLIAVKNKAPLKNDNVTMKGQVREASTGEALIGATIWIDSLKTGSSTNSYGFFSLSLPKGVYDVRVSFVGYKSIETRLTLAESTEENFSLESAEANLPELVVSPKDFDVLLTAKNTGYHKISRNIFGKIPYFLSEVDVLQGALLLPGIRNVGEDATGINVRGGSADNNLILLDEAVIFNTSHFFGLVGVFNPEAINDIEIYKGDVPASYGGRTSSVVSVRQREGNKERFAFSGGLGLLSGRLVAEGPLVKGKSSFLASVRSSLFNINYELGDNNVRRSTLNFADFNMKLNYDLNSKNKVYLSGYVGKDRNKVGETFQRTWGNSALIARWNHIFGNRLFSNHTFTLSEYSYKTEDPSEISNFIGTSYIFNYTFKSDFNFYSNPDNTYNFGYSSIIHRLNPGDRIPLTEDASVVEIKLSSEHAVEPALYGSWEKKWSRRIETVAGARWSRFYYLGPSNDYIYVNGLPKSRTSIVDTVQYKFGQIIDFYEGFEPRLVASYKLSKASMLKASYNKNYQYIHRITNSISPAPTDIWKLSDRYIKPQVSNQWTLGYYRDMFNGNLELSLEAYFKSLSNTIAFKNGADLLLNETIETEVLAGIGRAYGTELLVRKPEGVLRGWISYTLARAETQIKGATVEETLNDGDFFPSDYDRTHDVSVVSIYDEGRQWSFSATFNFSTGRPVTLPDAKYVYDGVIVPNFSKRNQGRLSDYHRLDLSTTYVSRKSLERKFKSSWTFSIYNVYARRNAYSYLFRQSALDPSQTETIRYSVLGTIIPSVSYNFKF